ncbi:MAG: DUF3431 domain-containing protein [Verrucomicrobiaceae bacterium]|nr:MAG: DUF3431 domain-containing protein [Verrucomicrobiaceae bacterium]
MTEGVAAGKGIGGRSMWKHRVFWNQPRLWSGFTGRKVNTWFMSGHDTCRLCVASHGENVDWVAKTGIEACIYDATGSRDGLIPTRNEAREASQYLRHIIAHYGQFRDYELFVQGDPFAHERGIDTLLRCQPWKGERVFPLSGHVHPLDPDQGKVHHEAAVIQAADSGIVIREGARWVSGAMFAASREAIESRTLGWWQRLLARVIIERTVSPWAMERLWLEILR